MDEAQARAFLISGATNTPTSTTTNTSAALAPRTTAVVDNFTITDPMGLSNIPSPPDPAFQRQQRVMAPKPSEAEIQARYINETEKNTGGVPLDTTKGVGSWERMMLAFRRQKEDQIKYLQGKYGPDNVQLDARGEPIVKVLDEDSGKAKFIPVNEENISLKDFLSIAGSVPEIAGGILALRAGKSAPGIGKSTGIVGAIRDILATTIGAETVGAAKDVGVKLIDDPQNITLRDVGEIGKERAAMGVADVGVGGALSLFGKVAGKVITPFGDSPGPIQFDAARAREYFRSKYGIDIPTTAGELTGNKFLQRSEAMLKKLPGASGDFAQIQKSQEEAFKKIQNIALGLRAEATSAERAAIPSEARVGQEAVSSLETKIDPIVEASSQSRKSAIQTVSDKLQSEVSRLVPGVANLFKSKVGQAIRQNVTAQRDAFESQANKLYETAKSLPGGRDRILAPPNIVSDARSLLGKLPAKNVVTQIPTGVVGPTGAPIMRTVTNREILREFVPDKVLGKLQSLSDLKGQKFSLEDLIQMRNDVTNDIKQGEAIPGVQTHFLGKIRDLLTKSIDESTSALPTGDLKTAWQNANKYYADNVGKFHRQGIAGILKDPDVPGFVGDSEIVGRLTSGSEKANDLFRDMREMLGPASPEYGMLKRSIADEVLNKSAVVGENLIDGKSFLKQLDNLFKSNPEIATEVFGRDVAFLTKLSKLEGVLSSGELLDVKDIQPLLAGTGKQGVGVIKAINDAMAKQTELTKVYKNKILKAIADRKLDTVGIEPEEFVSRFWNNASEREIQQVIGQLHDRPDVLNGIRQKVVQKIFYDAARNPAATDPVRLGTDAMRLPSSESLLKAFGGEVDQRKLQTILGNDTYRTLIDFAKVMRPGEIGEQAFSTAGGLSAGAQIGQMFRGGDLAYLANALKYKIGAMIITSPLLKGWASNTALSAADQHALVNAMVASTPFVRGLITDLGEEGASAAMEQIKGSIDRSVQTPTPQSKRDRAKVFLNSGNGTNTAPSIVK